MTTPSSLLNATTFVLLLLFCQTDALAAISLALLPLVEVWVDVALLLNELAPVVELWSQDLLLSLHGFAIA
ncbi:MAG TPA: hypothetical protein VHC91_25100 [Trinickia sp.]|nr:hypothetical protein [Trinickia sp.]